MKCEIAKIENETKKVPGNFISEISHRWPEISVRRYFGAFH